MKIYWKKEKLKNEVLLYAKSNEITTRRMKSIDRAPNFTDLRPDSNGRAHFLKGEEYKGCFSLDLEKKGNGKRLICTPRGSFKMDGDKYIEDTIVELEIIKIEDYH